MLFSLPPLPLALDLVFILITVGSVYWIYKATNSTKLLVVLVIWTLLQSVIAWLGILEKVDRIPPPAMLSIIPMILAIIVTSFLPTGRAWMKSWNLRTLTHLHVIRIPVEIVLFFLYSYGAISLLQTFEGWNWDILSGITAPIVAYLAFRGNLKRGLLLAWNIICLLLLINIVVISILALPVPFQQLAFDQPNWGILYFPYNLLASVIVPIVFAAHISSIMQLTGRAD